MPFSFSPAFITLIDTNLQPRLGIGSFFTITSMGQLIENLLFAIIAIASLLFLAYLGWASIRWLTAGGDKAQLETARSRVTQAFIGLSLVAATWAIFSLAVYALGLPFDLIQGTGGPTPTPPPGATPTPPDTCGCSASYTPTTSTLTVGASSTLSLNTNCALGATAKLATFFSTNITIADVSPTSIFSPPFQTTVTCNWKGTADINSTVEIRDCPPQTTVVNNTSAVTCVLIPNGGSCTRSGDCESGFCSSDQDNDGDGYYQAYSSGTGTCRPGPEDCRDNNANVHPNQFNYFVVPIPGEPGNFNYDCADSDGDTDVNDKWPQLNCLSTPPQATSCSLSPLPASTYQPQTGWNDTGIPNCGAELNPLGPGPLQRFWLCTAVRTDNCLDSPFNAEAFSCSAVCPTGNSCGWGEDELCNSWNMQEWIPYSVYLGGRTKMPCK